MSKTINKTMTYAAAKNDPRFLSIGVNGNKKLVNNESLRFITWNIPAITTCPYATTNCKKLCYAIKAERVYPNVKKQRANNMIKALMPDFAKNMIFTLENEIATKKYNDKKIVVRIHESGDFFNKAYAIAWIEIAKHFLSNKNIVFMAYTKSLVYFDGVEIPDNFVLRASVWDDTSAAALEMIEKNNYPIYTAVKTFDNFSGCRCRCEDCATCGKCWDRNENLIACEIH